MSTGPPRRCRRPSPAADPGHRSPVSVGRPSRATSPRPSCTGSPLWDVALDRVHVTRRPRAWNDTSRVLCCHVARLRDDEVTEVDGHRASPTRCARLSTWPASLPAPRSAVVTLDAGAARPEPSRTTSLRGRLLDIVGAPVWEPERGPGDRRCGRAERERRGVAEPGRPPPLAAAAVDACSTRSGRHGRCAGGPRRTSRGSRSASSGEFDGRGQVRPAAAPGQDAGEVVFAEKRREDAIRDEDWHVVRWVWAESCTAPTVSPHACAEHGSGRPHDDDPLQGCCSRCPELLQDPESANNTPRAGVRAGGPPASR